MQITPPDALTLLEEKISRKSARIGIYEVSSSKAAEAARAADGRYARAAVAA